MEILKDWARIEAWLNARAPDLLRTLKGPAGEGAVDDAERILGVSLPAEMKALYGAHDGQADRDGGFFDGHAWLPLRDVVSNWKVWKGLLDGGDFKDLRGEPARGVRDDWWHPAWIPFTHNGCGDHYCVDLAPAEGGAAGQVVGMLHDDARRALKAPSLGAWIRGFADGLERGDLVYSEEYGGLVGRDGAE